MKSRNVVFLAGLGVLGLACARGSDASPPDEAADAIEPTLPAAADAGPARGDASAPSSPPAADASGDAPVATPAPDAGPGTFVSGSASGVSIAPAHASAIVVRSGAFVERIVIAIQTRSGFCTDYSGGVDRAGERSLILAVVATGSVPVGSASFTIGTGQASPGGGTFDVSGRVLAYDSQCSTTVPASKENATSGTVTLTQVAAGGVVGTFSVAFPGGGQLSGALDADVCTAPGADSFTCSP